MPNKVTIEKPSDFAGFVIPANTLVEIKDANGNLIAHRDVSRPVDQKASSYAEKFKDGYEFPLTVEFNEHADAPAAPQQSEEA